MFFKRAVWVVCLLAGCVCPARAFTFSYGHWLDVPQVRQEGGALVLPLTNGKYRNVKVLSKDVYDFLLQCRQDCRYEADQVEFVSTDYRRALTHERMLIAEVELNGELMLTYLAFKNKNGISVKAPAAVTFRDQKLARRIQDYVATLAQETL